MPVNVRSHGAGIGESQLIATVALWTLALSSGIPGLRGIGTRESAVRHEYNIRCYGERTCTLHDQEEVRRSDDMHPHF